MKAIVDKEQCIGCGMCVMICPEVFCMNADERAEVCGDVTAENQAKTLEAVDSCPVAAISIEERQ